MPDTDLDPLDPAFDRRLKAALDRIAPPASFPRYAEKRIQGLRPWRMATIVVAAGAACLLALTALFTTGSPNPVVWTQRAASTIGSVGHAPEASPSPEPSQTAQPTKRSAPAKPAQHTEHEASPTPRYTERPEESPRPEPSGSGYPDGGRSGSSPSPSPWPSASPGDH